MKQSAVEWLENEILNSDLKMKLEIGLKLFALIKQAKEIEKEQMKNSSCPYVGGWEDEEFEYWYNKTFKQKTNEKL
jgi:hypothetical protein